MSRWRIKLGLTIPCGILLALLLTSSARADGPDMGTANYLFNACGEAIKSLDGKQYDQFEASYCLGYVRATFAAMSNLELLCPDNPPGYCLPAQTGEQSIRVIHKFMQAHPEYLHKPASWIAFFALGEAFPCEGAK